jgi:hypothetical protein
MPQLNLNLTVIEGTFAVCRVGPEAGVPDWAMGSNFFSVTRSPEELSIVCRAENVPADIQAEGDWRALKVHGILDFSMTGILNSLVAPLAEADIPLFAISTYNTDYILVRSGRLADAVTRLAAAGHYIME